MASSNDNGDENDSSESDVNLSGRLRNPGPNTTEIEPHDESEEAVDSVGDHLRSGGPAEPEEEPSIDEQSDPEELEAEEELESSLLDALETEEEDSGRSRTDTDDGLRSAEPSSDVAEDAGTTPGTGGSAEVGGEASEGRNRERTRQRSAQKGQRHSTDTDQAGQICSECNSISPAGMRFCVQCGTALRDADTGRKESKAPKLDRENLDEQIAEGFALVAINDDGTDGKSIALKSPKTIIGREGDTRFPTDEFLDPRHARLTVEDGDLHLEDLNSLNGSYIKLRDEVPLEAGDTFLMGRQVLRFERIEQDLDSKKTAEDGTRYMGSPAPGGDYKILQIGVGELVQNIYCLPESGVVLGREKGDIIFPRDKFMSGRHARIFTEDGPYLVDLNSSNGTWIKIWEKRQLDQDDYIFMGQQLFRVELPN